MEAVIQIEANRWKKKLSPSEISNPASSLLKGGPYFIDCHRFESFAGYVDQRRSFRCLIDDIRRSFDSRGFVGLYFAWNGFPDTSLGASGSVTSTCSDGFGMYCMGNSDTS